jgi:hypothetical protein
MVIPEIEFIPMALMNVVFPDILEPVNNTDLVAVTMEFEIQSGISG